MQLADTKNLRNHHMKKGGLCLLALKGVVPVQSVIAHKNRSGETDRRRITLQTVNDLQIFKKYSKFQSSG